MHRYETRFVTYHSPKWGEMVEQGWTTQMVETDYDAEALYQRLELSGVASTFELESAAKATKRARMIRCVCGAKDRCPLRR